MKTHTIARLGMAGTRAAWTVLGCLGLAGCFSPRISDAECLRCPDNVCPGNLVCLDQRCVDPSSPNSCPVGNSSGGTSSTGQGGSSSTGQGGESGESSAASGGTGNTGHGGTTSHGGHASGGTASGSGGTAGTVPEGGEPGTGGDTGAGGTGGIGIVVSPTTACSDVPTDVSLRGKNGTPPYSFELIGAPAGLSLVDEGDGATLSGVFTKTGNFTVSVRVTDDNKDSVTKDVTLNVKATPTLATTSLKDVCPDEIYQTELAATGGAGGPYTFTADGLDDTGLTVSDGKLTGHFVNASGKAGSIDVNVSVESDGCKSVPTTLKLKENPISATVCPTIAIVSDDPMLPLPCAGNEYGVSFTAYSGAEGYSWDSSLPPGLSFDKGTATVSGIPQTTAATTLTVQVTDENKRVIAHDFPFAAPRDKCWFAYLAPPTGTTQLNLLDPLLGNRRVFPSETNTDPALDFKFSPNGHLLAYRIGNDPSLGRLALIELSTFREQLFDFDSVSHYTWSADSHTLLVSFGSAVDPFLGGVDTSGDGGSGTALAFPELDPVSAEVDSDPVWFAGNQIAFFSGSGFPDVLTTTFSASGLAPVIDHFEDSFDDGSRLLPGPTGVFAITSNTFKLGFVPSDGSDIIVHDSVLVQPTGQLAARQENVSASETQAAFGQLDFFRATTSSDPRHPEEPDQKVPGCDALLGWARGGDQILCSHVRAENPQQSELVIFEVDSGTLAISNPITVRGSYDFPAVGLTGLARLFSPSGKRMAVTTDAAIFATPTAMGGAVADFTVDFDSSPGGSNAVLAFSPDERFLLEHRGSTLNLFDFESLTEPRPPFPDRGEVLPPAPACSEDYHAAAGSYCGEFRSRASFLWSPASWLPGPLLVALTTSTGNLLVKNVQVPGNIMTMNATDDCGQGCLAQDKFAFQP